ncbi:MAG TPA: TetR/AcrR family transcriptional regulator [Bryobacteraceae bacterium]|nr:TetR/AcrR family transcriptional regulator [Bryobacteraceae bacterium]
MVYRTTPLMEKRKEARKKRLLEVAVRLFGRKGFHATTVPAIVKAAGTSTGNFYFYFRNKEDIYAAALQQIGEDISAALNAAIAAAAPGVLRQMRAAVRGLVGFLAEHPEEARILIVESSGLGKHLETVRRQVVGSHTRSVEHALTAAAAQLAPLDTAVAASCWVGAVYEAVFHWLEQPPEQRVPAGHLADTIARFNLRAVGAPNELLEE